MTRSSDAHARVDAVRRALGDLDIETLLVTNPSNIRWLTGFAGSNALVLIDGDVLRFFTDGRYATAAPAELAAHGVDAEITIAADLVAAASPIVSARRLGLEADHITWAAQQRVTELVLAEVIPTSGVVAGLRACKDPGEVDRIRQAVRIADEALAEVLPLLTNAPTERAVAAALDEAMRQHGGAGPAYETIVASGPNAALPHARPTDRVITTGDLVIIDVGCLFEGYRSDMTRTVVVGSPDDEQATMLEIVLESQAAGVAAVGPGVAAASVDAACRQVLDDAGWGDRFVHGTGHGVGIDIHEQPAINGRSDDVLAPGMIVTVEPGVYVEGSGGVRWEDLLLVTDTGAEVLTASPKPFTVSL